MKVLCENKHVMHGETHKYKAKLTYFVILLLKQSPIHKQAAVFVPTTNMFLPKQASSIFHDFPTSPSKTLNPASHPLTLSISPHSFPPHQPNPPLCPQLIIKSFITNTKDRLLGNLQPQPISIPTAPPKVTFLQLAHFYHCLPFLLFRWYRKSHIFPLENVSAVVGYYIFDGFVFV